MLLATVDPVQAVQGSSRLLIRIQALEEGQSEDRCLAARSRKSIKKRYRIRSGKHRRSSQELAAGERVRRRSTAGLREKRWPNRWAQSMQRIISCRLPNSS